MPYKPARSGAKSASGRSPWKHDYVVERITGTKLQRMRKRLFDKQPLCVLCQAVNRVSLATIRDHVIPLAEGGRDDESNEQAVCASCHLKKTQQESVRGRRRAAE